MPDRIAVASVLALVVAGCQIPNARYVSKGPNTGEVAMPTDTPANRERARKLMSAHFPDGYEIVWESEKVVGETVRENVHTHNRFPGAGMVAGHSRGKKHKHTSFGFVGVQPALQNTHRTTSSVDQTEWRIQYRRRRGRLSQPGGSSIGHLPTGDSPNGGAEIVNANNGRSPKMTSSPRYDTIVPAGAQR